MDYFGWKPVTMRRRQAAHRLAGLRRKGQEASPVFIEGRKIATTFWGTAWCENLERYSDYENRLPRGRTYVRNGSVIDLQIAPGAVRALVSGSDIYDVRIDVARVPRARWRAICRDCTGAIDSLVELLQGRLSASVMARICEPKTGLFPAPKEISFHCSCPDWAWMCKHVAAVLYGIGARLDELPELLFLLRSVDQQDLIAEADTGLRPATKGPAAAKALDTSDLSQIFGIEMAPVEPAPVPAVRRRQPVRASARTSPRAGGAGSAQERARTSGDQYAETKRGGQGASRPRDSGATDSTPAAPAFPKRNTPAVSTTAARAPAWSAAKRAAVSARMKAYWRDRQRQK